MAATKKKMKVSLAVSEHYWVPAALHFPSGMEPSIWCLAWKHDLRASALGPWASSGLELPPQTSSDDR